MVVAGQLASQPASRHGLLDISIDDWLAAASTGMPQCHNVSSTLSPSLSPLLLYFYCRHQTAHG